MTSNQIAYFQYAESFRHNAEVEKENKRHNQEMEYYNTVSNQLRERELFTAQYEADTRRRQELLNERLAEIESKRLAQTVRANDIQEAKVKYDRDIGIYKAGNEYNLGLINAGIKERELAVREKEIEASLYSTDTKRKSDKGSNIIKSIQLGTTLTGVVAAAAIRGLFTKKAAQIRAG